MEIRPDEATFRGIPIRPKHLFQGGYGAGSHAPTPAGKAGTKHGKPEKRFQAASTSADEPQAAQGGVSHGVPSARTTPSSALPATNPPGANEGAPHSAPSTPRTRHDPALSSARGQNLGGLSAGGGAKGNGEDDEDPGHLAARVVRAISRKDSSGRHTEVFTLQCAFGGMEWWQEKTIAEFTALDHTLRSMMGEKAANQLLPRFPRKHMRTVLSGVWRGDGGAESLNQRRVQLDEYVSKLAQAAGHASNAGPSGFYDDIQQRGFVQVFHALYKFADVVKNTVRKREEALDDDDGSGAQDECSEAVRLARAKVKHATDRLNDAVVKAAADREMKKDLGRKVRIACAFWSLSVMLIVLSL